MKRKQILAAALAAILCPGLISCTGGEKLERPAEKAVETVSMWMPLTDIVTATVSNFSETPFAQELEKRTGVHVEYLHPSKSQQARELILLLAGDEVPDMISWSWYNFGNGIEHTIENGFVTRLNDLIDAYSPSLKSYLQQNPEIDSMVKTKAGDYYVYPFLREDERLTVYTGPMVRRDWLNRMGLAVPETIDDWTSALRSFKETGVEIPFNGEINALVRAFGPAYGIKMGFFMEGGQVKYGYTQPEYKGFLAKMNQWYTEGLVNKNLGAVDFIALENSVLNGMTGAVYAAAGSGMGHWSAAAGEPGFDLAPAKYPVLQRGEKSAYGARDPMYGFMGAVAMSGKSKHKETCAKFLDYGYSEEGHMFYNFGTEGVSYQMVEGYPQYTDLILHNPDGLSITNAMGRYMMSCYSGPFVQDLRYQEQYYTLPQQREAIELWSEATSETDYALPPYSAPADEISEMDRLTDYIDPYAVEMQYKFIVGVEPLSNYDAYLNHLKSLDLDALLQMKQKAVDNYLAP